MRWPLALALLGILGACGNTAAPGHTVPVDGWGYGNGGQVADKDSRGGPSDADNAADNTSANADSATPAGDVAAGSQLLFAMPNGNKDDFGGFCDQLCKLKINQNGLRRLYVKHLIDGQPVVNGIVQFSVKGGTEPLGEVLLANAITDDKGIAWTEVKGFTKLGVFDVVATVPGDADAGGKVFELHLASKAKGPLTIRLHYLGSSNPFEYTWLKAQLVQQPAAGVPACKDIDLGATPPDENGNPLKIQWESPANLKWDQPWSITYKIFPAWVEKQMAQTGGPVHFTVLGLAKVKAGGPVKAGGCIDTGATVTWNPTTKTVEGDDITVVVRDIPPRLQGTYDMVTNLDLLSVLPDTVEFVFKSIFDILTDPIAGTLSLACKLGGGSLDSFCGLVFEDVKKPSIDTLKQPFGALIVKFLNAIIYGFLPDPVKKGLDTGADLGKILTDLEIGGTITIDKEPDPVTGKLSKEFTEDEWTTITYKWSLGQNCNPKDPNCGKKTFPINAFQSKTIVGHFDLVRDAFKSELAIAKHGLLVKWGALINYIVQKQLLPAITADPNDPAAPVIDSYEKLIKSLLADKQCLVKDTCCEDFGKAMEKQQSLVKAGFLAGVCEAMVKLGTGFLEAQLNALDTDTGKGETMTLWTEACPLFDINGNQFIDRMGAKSDPCNWNLTIKIGGKPQNMNASFWATRQQ